MRILVACELCKRQYDAGSLPAGALFRCRCGGKVQVPRVAAKDAAVVRCSSCGGPRSKGELSCRYCKADFTLHEQDLETVCPACMARVGNGARFCHHCGIPILVAEEASASGTDRSCPACGPSHPLRSRELGRDHVSMLECNRCAGIWLAQQSFALLVERARTSAETEGGPPGAGKAAQARARTAAAGPLYRRCPACSEMMHRFNFGKRSGVIVDSCKDHGVWFDAEELESALAWVRKGGEERAKKVAEEEAKVSVGSRFVQQRIDRMASGEQGTTADTGFFAEILSGIFDL